MNAKQAAFVREYLLDLNATQAAIRAGYPARSARSKGAQLLANVNVAEAIQLALKNRAERVEVKADDVLRELLRLALVDVTDAFDEQGNLRPLKDMPKDLRRAVSSLEWETVLGDTIMTDDGIEVQSAPIARVGKLKFWDKTKALEMLAKHLGLLTDKLDVEHHGNVTLKIVRTVKA